MASLCVGVAGHCQGPARSESAVCKPSVLTVSQQGKSGHLWRRQIEGLEFGFQKHHFLILLQVSVDLLHGSVVHQELSG